MLESRKLLTFEFLGLFLVTFLAFCNVTIFYDLFNYLQTIGIPADLRGLVIGSYSLTAMVLYLLVSPFLTAANAPRTILLGIVVVALCGISYLSVHSFWGLLGLRMMNGCGQFLMGAGAMTLFVSIIPKEQSGQAFAIYSLAILLPYGAVPVVMDALAIFIPTPPHGYAYATITLIPAAWIVLHIRRRRREQSGMVERKHLPAWSDIRANVTQLPVALLLLLNIMYIINWSSMFFLIKGFADQQGIMNVGSFFTVQTGMMIGLRLLAGRLFDSFDKTRMGKAIGEKQAELNKQKDEYQNLFELVPCLITIQDKALKLIRYNREFADKFSPKHGDYCFQAYKGLNTPCSPCPVERTFQDGLPHYGEESRVNTLNAQIAQLVPTS